MYCDVRVCWFRYLFVCLEGDMGATSHKGVQPFISSGERKRSGQSRCLRKVLLFFQINYSALLNNNLHIHLLISTNFHYRYDPNRIIAYQRRKPERLYSVLTGKGKRIVKRKKQLSYIDR